MLGLPIYGNPHIRASRNSQGGLRDLWDKSGLQGDYKEIRTQRSHVVIEYILNVAPLLVEGFGLMKSFRGIIQNQLLFEGFGIMKSFWDRNKKNS